jgi:hypothetical protein
MASATHASNAADVKADLEKFVGHEISASADQLAQQLRILSVPISTYAFTLRDSSAEGLDAFGHVAAQIIIPNVPLSCAASAILDLCGSTVTPPAGNVTLSVLDFICPFGTAGLVFNEPVSVVATPDSTQPFFLTVKHSLVVPPDSGFATNINIDIFAWHPNGTPAANVGINWRCRAPAGLQFS